MGFFILIILLLFVGCRGKSTAITPIPTSNVIVGFDASEAKAAEDAGVEFKDIDGQIKPALQIFKDHGYSWVRIRKMVDPAIDSDGNYGLLQDLDYVKTMARDAKKLGLKFLLNFHYSHWWADPENQWTPPRWKEKSLSELTQAVYDYTHEIITELRKQNTMPDMVQIGNEIRGGMLWPVGKIGEEEESWDNLVTLSNAAVNAVKDASELSSRPLIMIHIHGGGDLVGTEWFFDNFVAHGGEFDVIGLSYYPMWHGTFKDLEKNIISNIKTYKKEVYIIETSYYWDTNKNGYRDAEVPYSQTPQGQYDYLQDLKKVIKKTGAKGVFYWGSHWTQSDKWLVAPGWSDDDASRRSLFDDEAKATKGIRGLLD